MFRYLVDQGCALRSGGDCEPMLHPPSTSAKAGLHIRFVLTPIGSAPMLYCAILLIEHP